jgi:O-antigen/teichoic acid export membrane protein
MISGINIKKNISFLKSLSIYTGSNIINAAIPFLLLPFLTRVLSPEAYGIVAIFQVLLSFTLPLTGMNLEGAVARQYFEKDKINFPSYLSNSLFLMLTGTITVLGAALIFSGSVEKITAFPADWVWIIVICAFSQNISEIMLSYWLVQSKALPFGLFRISRTVLDISLSVLLILIFEKSWEGRIEGQFAASVFFAIITIGLLWKSGMIKLVINRDYIRNALRYGLPLVPHVLGAVLMTMSDKIFITNMVGIADTGLYSAGFQVGLIIGLFQNSFNQAWVPRFFEKLKLQDININIKIVKFTYLYFVLILLSGISLGVSAPYILDNFLGKNFYTAHVFVFWIAIGFSFNGMYKMVVNYFFFTQKTYIVSIVTLTTALLNLFLNYFFIKYNGAVGAAQATALSFLLQFIFIWYLSAKHYKMPWLFFLKSKNKF